VRLTIVKDKVSFTPTKLRWLGVWPSFLHRLLCHHVVIIIAPFVVIYNIVSVNISVCINLFFTFRIGYGRL
jgi:hypothetical protein